eukprot:g15639.t1
MSTKVFVHNLPYGLYEADVKKMFDDAGDIRAIEIMLDKGKKPRGIAVIDFEKEEDAKYCIEKYNEKEVEGRRITCREDRGSGYVHPDSYKPKGEFYGKDYDRDYDRKGRGRGRDDSRGRGRGYKGYKGYDYGGDRYYEERYKGGKGRADSRGRRDRGRDRSRSRSRGRY